MLLEVKNLSHKYDQRKTDGINHLNLSIKSGKITGLIGPSGCGKTTTLKCIAGLLKYEGDIEYKLKENIISYVDQTPTISKNLSVYEFLKLHLDHIEDEEKVSNQIRSTLSLLNLTNEIESQIDQISGGQRQRVIIASALVKNPNILLLDEPFANLDRTLRIELMNELFELFKEQQISVIWVTHNTDEAMAYSDELILLNYGELQQAGTPQDLYYKPKNLFTANFLSEVNPIASSVVAIEEKTITINLFNENISLPKYDSFNKAHHNDLLVLIRPDAFFLNSESTRSANIVGKIFKGERTLLTVDYKNHLLQISVPSKIEFKNNKVRFDFKPEDIYYLSEI